MGATLLGLAAYSSARTSLQELVPWLPPTFCLLVLITVYFPRKIRQSINGYNGSQIAMEEGRPCGHDGTTVEPGSVQSNEDYGANRTNRQSLDVEHWLEHEISHIGGARWPISPEPGRLSTRESEIDLEDSRSVKQPVSQRMVSESCQGRCMGKLPATASDSRFPIQGFSGEQPSSRLSLLSGTEPASSEFVAVESPSFTSALSEEPLPG